MFPTRRMVARLRLLPPLFQFFTSPGGSLHHR